MSYTIEEAVRKVLDKNAEKHDGDEDYPTFQELEAAFLTALIGDTPKEKT